MNREILIKGGVGIAALLFIGFALSNRLICRHHTVVSKKIASPFRVAHITDLHESRFGENQKQLVAALKESKPDLIFFTGDIIEDGSHIPAEGNIIADDNASLPLLREAAAIAPCYMVLGNHESNIPRTDNLCDELSSLGIRVLHRANEIDDDMAEAVTVQGNEILICGADDPYFDWKERKSHVLLTERLKADYAHKEPFALSWRDRLSREYRQISKDERLTLLLCHRPEEYELYRALGFDAAFSGHAHGGQFRIPLILNGLYAPHQGFFPQHAGGVYQYEDFTHIVSRGLSKKRMVRIFNRPELWLVDFVPADKYCIN